MANHPCYQLVEIVDNDLPVYVAMQRIGERYLDLAWEYRHLVDNALMRFLRGLDAKPQCRVILGNGAPLTWREARALMQYQRQRVADMSGSIGPPDFALWPPVNRGGREHRRPCVRVRGDVVQGFASIDEAARTLRTSTDDVAERVESGHRDGEGWAFFDGKPQKS